MTKTIVAILLTFTLAACVSSNGAPQAARATYTPAPATPTRVIVTPHPTDPPAYPAPHHGGRKDAPGRGLECAHC